MCNFQQPTANAGTHTLLAKDGFLQATNETRCRTSVGHKGKNENKGKGTERGGTHTAPTHPERRIPLNNCDENPWAKLSRAFATDGIETRGKMDAGGLDRPCGRR
jgi:hypothetical protein